MKPDPGIMDRMIESRRPTPAPLASLRVTLPTPGACSQVSSNLTPGHKKKRDLGDVENIFARKKKS